MALRIIFDNDNADQIDYEIVNSQGDIIGQIQNVSMQYHTSPLFINTVGTSDSTAITRGGDMSITIELRLYPTAFMPTSSGKPVRKLIKYTGVEIEEEKVEEVQVPVNYSLRQRRLSEEA